MQVSHTSYNPVFGINALQIVSFPVTSSSKKHRPEYGYPLSRHYGASSPHASALYAILPVLLLCAASSVLWKVDCFREWYVTATSPVQKLIDERCCICLSFTDGVTWPCGLVSFIPQHRYPVLLEVRRSFWFMMKGELTLNRTFGSWIS